MERNSAWKTQEAVMKDTAFEIDSKGQCPMLQRGSKGSSVDRITTNNNSVFCEMYLILGT